MAAAVLQPPLGLLLRTPVSFTSPYSTPNIKGSASDFPLPRTQKLCALEAMMGEKICTFPFGPSRPRASAAVALATCCLGRSWARSPQLFEVRASAPSHAPGRRAFGQTLVMAQSF